MQEKLIYLPRINILCQQNQRAKCDDVQHIKYNNYNNYITTRGTKELTALQKLKQKANKIKTKQKLGTALKKIKIEDQEEMSESISCNDEFLTNNNLLQSTLNDFDKIKDDFYNLEEASFSNDYAISFSDL